MKRSIKWVWENLLFVETLFLLAFIPLYPKLPLIDIKNTWVYIRAEDFVVAFALISWFVFLIRGKVSLKTPLTIPILIFWVIGAIATVHGVVLIFPKLANVFPNVALLEYLRHIEYFSLFFIAYAAMREKKYLTGVIAVIVATLVGVIIYGLGQKYLGFPAYLTMNEEFAKGIPIQLSQLSRLPSTFAGHYDLAAYLVLIVPIVASLIFGFKSWIIKGLLALTMLAGFAVMFMTVSRVSFVVLAIAIGVVVFFHRRKWVLYSIPLVIIAGILFLTTQSSLFDRFGNTVKEINVLVDTKTGEAIGHVTYVPSNYFDDKLVLQRRIKNEDDLALAILGEKEPNSTRSAILPKQFIPPIAPLVVATNVSNGETLPQGTGYINLSLSPVTKRMGNVFYELAPNTRATDSAKTQVLYLHGDFLIKRASAYDLSFTTRFQGEWPHALAAFERDIMLGSGYGSVSLAVDNNYFRMLGEIGLLGTAAFFAIFLCVGIYIKKIWKDIDSPVARSFVIGYVAGLIGLALNATLIDVFEASKVAFTLWLLTGVTLGLLHKFHTRQIELGREFRKAITSPWAVVVYLALLTITIYSPLLANYFVADDFTWFRWAADCKTSICGSTLDKIIHFFTVSDGFFYRPGTKVYFELMYPFFWLNQVVYHLVSVVVHFGVAVLFYLLARRILRNNLLATIAAFLFLIMSGYVEIVFWISATGHLFNAFFALLALQLYMMWDDRKQIIYFFGAVVSIGFSLLFHELGVAVPILLIGYKVLFSEPYKFRKAFLDVYNWILFLPVVGYLGARFMSGSHWQGGDYSYNLIKLPFNIIGNLIGYLSITLFGSMSISFYDKLREVMRGNIFIAAIAAVLFGAIGWLVYTRYLKNIDLRDKRVIYFCLFFFVVALLPFLGLGNISSRYSYLSSLGIIMLLVYFGQKLYNILLESGREIAVGAILMLALVFALVHIIAAQQMQADFRTAGDRVKNFFVGIEQAYSTNWSNEPVELHFVNIPIKTGDAWIFPVGLPDAIWFAFRNNNLKIFNDSSVEQAVGPGTSILRQVFKFEDDGTLKEIVRPAYMVNQGLPQQ